MEISKEKAKTTYPKISKCNVLAYDLAENLTLTKTRHFDISVIDQLCVGINIEIRSVR